MTVMRGVSSLTRADFLWGTAALWQNNGKTHLRQHSTVSTTTSSAASSSSTSSITSTTTFSGEEQQQQQNSFEVSLWLIPPSDVNDKLQSEIDRLAFLHAPDASGISFAPHVTVVGGISVNSPAQVDGMVQTLRDGLKGFGSVDCEFDTQLAFETKQDDNGQIVVWNQAAAATLHVTPAFLQLCQTARILIGMQNTDCLFPPPILHPHMSLYYGRKGVPLPNEIEPVPAFTADRVSLWKTWPSDNEQGVLQWRELAVISL
eukprot:scaffold846_cov168-Amphora_coffeaeformis.AAC.16